MAGALIPGRPRRPRLLRVFVDFDTPADLEAALAHLDPVVTLPGLRRVLMQVRYRPDTLSAAAARHHLAFARRHPGVSTYLPFCLPGTPRHAEFGPLATPSTCGRCLFYEGRACQGLGHEEASFGSVGAGPALQPVTRPPGAYGRADFAAAIPIAYWMPTPTHLEAISAVVGTAGGRLWDIGGANGHLAASLAARGLDVTVIDPLDVYPTPDGVRRIVADVRAVEAPAPDALLISWPPTGDGFRDVVERLAPRVVIYAWDADGACGRRRGYARIEASAAGLRWQRWPRDDFAPIPGLPVWRTWRVRSHHDLRRGGPPQGRLQVRVADPLATSAETG